MAINKLSAHSKKQAPKKYFLVNHKTQFAIREAYKSVRTNLLSILSAYENTCKQICFTSPEIGDGKTINCANIAVSFSEMGAKVLVIDADMRKPKLHRVFKLPAAPGLSECIGGFCEVQKAIVPYKDAPGVFVLPSGKIPPNPTELILSKRFNDLLRAIEDDYDYIFIDAPPTGLVTDATIISQKTLGAVLICKSGSTKSDVAKKAKEVIEQAGGKVLGALLNGIDFKKSKKRSKLAGKYHYYDEYINGDSDD